MVFTTEGFLFLEETIEIWSEWDLNSQPMNSVQSSYRLSYTLYLIASIRTQSWVQFALRANIVQLLQFHLYVQCSHFSLAIASVSRHICFKQNLAQVITLVAKWIDAYGIHHWRIPRNSYKKLETPLDDCFWLSFISSWYHYRSLSPSQTSNKLITGFESAQNVSSGVDEWMIAVVTIIILRHHNSVFLTFTTSLHYPPFACVLKRWCS